MTHVTFKHFLFHPDVVFMKEMFFKLLFSYSLLTNWTNHVSDAGSLQMVSKVFHRFGFLGLTSIVLFASQAFDDKVPNYGIVGESPCFVEQYIIWMPF